ncbi:hypothetical protein [Roseibium litorale]|uniref:Uncharacterized protein n=1 Tax=Roseibium litorale TaxID=2803841 RepID=A0ABR9CTE6_9HYPH|nr:hypothetical protein [Roseibium litorale]MBD8894125.1 hypothetical protein [Roseibium litorale]
MKIMKAATCLFYLVSVGVGSVETAQSQQSFSCPWGREGACLDYGDKVCSSFAKCVANDSVCFNSYTCDYNGFVCKSDFNNLNEDYDGLVGEYNRLVSIANDLKRDAEYSEEQVRVLKREVSELRGKYGDVISCLEALSSLDDAQSCAN